MSQLELEQALYEEGMMVSGIISKFRSKKTNISSPTQESGINKKLNTKEIIDLSPTKQTLQLQDQVGKNLNAKVSVVVKNNDISLISQKQALFNLTYMGPCWAQPIRVIMCKLSEKTKKLIIYDDSWHPKNIKLSKKVKEYIIDNISKESTK